MKADMAPPLKRRKLFDSPADESISYWDDDNVASPPESRPQFPHAVELIHSYSPLAPPRTLSKDDAAQQPPLPYPEIEGIKDIKVLLPRQGTDVSSTDLVSTTSSTPSATDSTTAESGTPSTTSLSSSKTGSEASSTVSSLPLTDTTTDLSATSTGISSSVANLTTSSGSPTTTSRNISETSSTYLYLATLSDGQVSTVNRSSHAYTTTFSDGEIFTIPAISASTTKSSSRTSSSLASKSTAFETTSTGPSNNQQVTITSAVTVDAGSTPTSSTITSSTGSASGGGGGGGGGNNDNTPPASTIAGGVVGGAAGVAVVVLIAMLFVRWYRRKGEAQHHALPPGSTNSPGMDPPFESSREPGMAERAGLMPFMAAVPAFFRHQNRSIGESEPSEREFTRVSGRKLPSAFSGGMSSEDVYQQQQQQSSLPPNQARGLNSTYYQGDGDGFYDGDGNGGRGSTSSANSGPSRLSPDEMTTMTMSRGPQRRPQVHTVGPYVLSPTGSDILLSAPASTATFARSDTPSTLRNSRFTEDM